MPRRNPVPPPPVPPGSWSGPVAAIGSAKPPAAPKPAHPNWVDRMYDAAWRGCLEAHEIDLGEIFAARPKDFDRVILAALDAEPAGDAAVRKAAAARLKEVALSGGWFDRPAPGGCEGV